MIENNGKISCIKVEFIKNKEYLELCQDMLLCKLCTNVLNNPKGCNNCQCFYCFDCLSNYNEMQYSKDLLKCPQGCENNNFNYDTKIILKFLSKLEFYCVKECEKLICHSNYINHVNDCKGIILECPLCHTQVNKKSIDISYFEIKKNDEIKFSMMSDEISNLKEQILVLKQRINNNETYVHDCQPKKTSKLHDLFISKK